MHAHDKTKGVAGKARTPTRTPESATRSPNRAQAASQSLLALQGTHGNAAVVQMLRATGNPRAAIQRASEQNRPMITHQDPADDWEADNTAPARAGGLVLSGHGAWRPANGDFRVPAGTRVHFYTQHGMVLPDDLGGQVENGTNQRGSVEQGQQRGASRTVVGGRSLRNYTISYPSGLRIQGNPAIATPVAGGYEVELDPETQNVDHINVTTLTDARLAGHSIVFSGDVLLSAILQPNMGDVHFAACRFVETGRPGTRNQGRPPGHNHAGDPGEAGGLYNP
ncbi:putative adhesin [Kitasatospora sp. NPDC086801]|uniref:putative adhesin n=1 Tax=Kitasatospora sp. NPDC086801 TaxID=3364066 RepID=UPI003827C1FE